MGRGGGALSPPSITGGYAKNFKFGMEFASYNRRT